jgi:hypothetical protein
MSSTSSKTGAFYEYGCRHPLRHRMIEDVNARKLCAGAQRGHIHSCKRFAAFLNRSPGPRDKPHLILIPEGTQRTPIFILARFYCPMGRIRWGIPSEFWLSLSRGLERKRGDDWL